MSTSDEKLKAAYALNLCMVSVSQIVDYNDTTILEQERDNILNNINLEQIIKDRALLDAIKGILDQITYMEIAAGNKQIIEAEYQNRVKSAIWTAIPNMGLLLATGNPIAMGITIASQVGIGYMNYRRNKAEYQAQREKKLWELKEHQLNQLNHFRQRIFEAAWILADTYNFPDKYRLTTTQIHEYNLALIEQNAIKRYEKLNIMRNQFMAYPQFWYQIGSTANSVYQDKTLDMTNKTREFYKERAIEYFEEYYHLNKFSILRNDVITAAWALEYIDLLDLSKPEDISKGSVLADIAEQNAGTNNCDILELCAYAQLKLGDKDHAAQLFKKLVAQSYNLEVNARILSGLYIQQSRQEDTRDCALIEYEKLALLTDQKYLLPLPAPDEEWVPEWKNKESSSENPDADVACEEITLSHILHIAEGETLKYQNKVIHFRSLINCEGSLEFQNCVLHYNETENADEIKLTSTAALSMGNCTIINHSYDEHFFLDASEMVNEVRLTNCEFVNCCWFLQFGNNLTMRQCKIVNAGVNFISNCAGKATITECEFCLIAKPDFFPEESYKDAISCSEAEMSRCSVQGPLKISSTASAAEKASAGGYSSWYKRYFSWTTGTVTNCSFCGVKDLFALGGYSGSVTVSSCTFEQCLAVFWGLGPITVEDCRFENCTKIGTSLSLQSLVAYCQFNDCFCELFSTGYDGGISIRFCEFNNWADGRPDDSIFVPAMLSFQKTRKDGVNSTVSDCVFNGMSAHYSFLIKGHAHEKIDGYAVVVEKCSFMNCTTDRESGKIIKIYDYYFPRLSKKRKEQTVTWVSNCRGLDQVNNGSNVNTDVVIKTKNSAGAKIGVALATVVAGVPGYVAASLITKAAADDDIHVE